MALACQWPIKVLPMAHQGVTNGPSRFYQRPIKVLPMAHQGVATGPLRCCHASRALEPSALGNAVCARVTTCEGASIAQRMQCQDR